MRSFVWDPAKAAANFAKHGVTFEDAMQVFDDPFAVSVQDRIENGDFRWRVTGMTDGAALLVVSHTYWDEEHDVEIIRIISARRAERRERRRYEEG